MNTGGYSVKGVKLFEGREGEGFNLTLLRNGKPVAFCIDSGNGGDVRMDWTDGGWQGAEAKALDAHLASLPPEKWQDKDSSHDLPVSSGMFLWELVNVEQEKKTLRRWCKRKTVFRVDGEKYGPGAWAIFETPCTPESRQKVESRYPGRKIVYANDLVLA